MEFRILGPLEVQDGDRLLPLGGARQRAVLALLLTRAGEVVSRDRLIDELWGEGPPESAVNVLQTYVSHLRKLLPAGVLTTRPPGYMVEVGPGELDLHRLEQLVVEAEGAPPAVAATKLREALALWRGPALADFAYEPFAQAAIARLEELRLAALERRLDADLALGGHAELVGELEALVREHPLRERLRGQLMLALYRSGRQAEALDVYQEARRVLVEELGIDPSPGLQQLERAILRQDSSLEPARAAAAPVDLPAPERSLLVAPLAEASMDALLALAEPLAGRPAREVILARLVGDASELAEATRLVAERREALIGRGVAARTAAFTSSERGEDVVRLASEQSVNLLLIDAAEELLEDGAIRGDLGAVLAGAPCDVAVLAGGERRLDSGRAVLVPFGGGDNDWAAVEIAAWIARAHGASLRLVGAAANPEQGRRDASRLLASVSLSVQQVTGIAADPLLVEPGAEAVIGAAEDAGLVVVGLSGAWRQEGLGAVRLAVARGARPQTLFVRGGLRPGGLAPQQTLTRFTWTLAGAGA